MLRPYGGRRNRRGAMQPLAAEHVGELVPPARQPRAELLLIKEEQLYLLGVGILRRVLDLRALDGLEDAALDVKRLAHRPGKPVEEQPPRVGMRRLRQQRRRADLPEDGVRGEDRLD